MEGGLGDLCVLMRSAGKGGRNVPSPIRNKLPNPSGIREMWVCVPDLVFIETQFSLLQHEMVTIRICDS
jgi:hypothetical protein